MSLRTDLNKCWYHATLHLLTAIPPLRTACLKTVDGCPIFESKFTAAIQAMLNHRGVNEVNDFFKLVMDFSGINNRFGGGCPRFP